MSNTILYGSLGATGAPLTSTLVTIDGSLVMAVGLAAFLVAGVLFSAAIRRWRSNRRLTLRPVPRLRRAAV
jgi:uncharacterized membrane protein YhhN